MEKTGKTVGESCKILKDLEKSSAVIMESGDMHMYAEDMDTLCFTLDQLHDRIIDLLPTALSFPILMKVESFNTRNITQVHPFIDPFRSRARLAVKKIRLLLNDRKLQKYPEVQRVLQEPIEIPFLEE